MTLNACCWCGGTGVYGWNDTCEHCGGSGHC